jgi:hypothetical protein
MSHKGSIDQKDPSLRRNMERWIARSIPVTIWDVEYSAEIFYGSLSQAAKELNCDRGSIRRRQKGKTKSLLLGKYEVS